MATPSLAEGIEAICSRESAEPKRVRRSAAPLVRYLLRATGRATPFGLFAGTAPACFAEKVKVRWGSSHQPGSGADAVWLDDVLTRLEAVPRVLERLWVQVTICTGCVVAGWWCLVRARGSRSGTPRRCGWPCVSQLHRCGSLRWSRWWAGSPGRPAVGGQGHAGRSGQAWSFGELPAPAGHGYRSAELCD